MACLHNRVNASMHDRSYFCQVRLHVIDSTELEECSSGRKDTPQDKHHHSPQARLITVSILHAVCGCKSGLSGNCHHVHTLLQLIRVLTLSDFEQTQGEALTCTGQLCDWLWNHQKGGSEHSVFWAQPVSHMTSLYDGAKNPRNQPRGIPGSVLSYERDRATGGSGGAGGKDAREKRTRTVRNRPREYKKTFDSRTGNPAGLFCPRERSDMTEVMEEIRFMAEVNMEKGGRRTGTSTVRAQDRFKPRHATI